MSPEEFHKRAVGFGKPVICDSDCNVSRQFKGGKYSDFLSQ